MLHHFNFNSCPWIDDWLSKKQPAFGTRKTLNAVKRLLTSLSAEYNVDPMLQDWFSQAFHTELDWLDKLVQWLQPAGANILAQACIHISIGAYIGFEFGDRLGWGSHLAWKHWPTLHIAVYGLDSYLCWLSQEAPSVLNEQLMEGAWVVLWYAWTA
jgi:hypothetical protein